MFLIWDYIILANGGMFTVIYLLILWNTCLNCFTQIMIAIWQHIFWFIGKDHRQTFAWFPF